MNFPLCVFGKPEKLTGSKSSYSIINCHEVFSGVPLTIFNQVSRSFNWRSGGHDRFCPAYAYWPLDTAKGLTFRFLDMGRDSFGRPHTLRLEAALVTGSSWDVTKTYLNSASWPEQPCTASDIVDLSPISGVMLGCPPQCPIFLIEPHKGECSLFSTKH